jgi:hypothetical protein
MSPDRIIQSGWLSKFNPFNFAVIPLAPNLTTTFYGPVTTINV